jgi:23S rRNA-/tRNA-specific pseudouridylate synthase
MTMQRPINIVRMGDGWMAVEKPSGISIHNDPGSDLRSLLAAQCSGGGSPMETIDVGPGGGFNAVGRLDKEADGLVLVSWRSDVFAELSAQYAARETGKTYLVLLYGQLKGAPSDAGDLDWAWPLSKDAAGRRNPAGRPPRRRCLTQVDILEVTRRFTLIRCRPHTGRKHQIRRHAALAGHPVAGDRRYGTAGHAERLKSIHGFDRIGLHASELTFRPPESEAAITIESSGMPEIFTRLLNTADTD